MKNRGTSARSLGTGGSISPVPRRRANTSGYTLLEMLVYIVVFGVALNMMASLLGSGSRLAATTTLGLGRLEGIRDVEEVFTNYTRRAAAVAGQIGDYETGAHRLVLKMPPGGEEGFDYVVLGALNQPDQFSVLGLAAGGAGWETVYLRTLRQPLQTLEFHVDNTGAAPAVHLDVQVKGEEGERKQSFLVHRSSAVPRGIGP